MKIEKAQWSNNDSRVTMHFPIAKVNKEKRTVSGFATLDNLDHHKDVVMSDASERAFARFRGNIREQHGKTAVGKMLDFHTEDYFDKESGKTYKGIYVNAYVSKGAQDTWEKVLDGTLTGFSIGGNIVNASFDKENDGARIIEEYDMTELSLVDSPANPLANILSIQKSENGNLFSGIAAETELDNVFWCNDDRIASTATSDVKNCVICEKEMTNIGWVEKTDTDRSVSISKVVDAYLRKDDAPGPDHSATTLDADAGVIGSDDTINLYPDQNKTVKKEVINKMADEVVTENVDSAEAPVVEETVVVEEVAEVTETASEEVEKSIDSTESTDSFAKMLTDLKDLFDSTIEKSFAEVDSKIEKSVVTVESAREEMMSAVHKAIEGLTNNVADLVKRMDALEKKADSIESDTAMKKSLGDVEITKSKKPANSFSWNGSFLGVENL